MSTDKDRDADEREDDTATGDDAAAETAVEGDVPDDTGEHPVAADDAEADAAGDDAGDDAEADRSDDAEPAPAKADAVKASDTEAEPTAPPEGPPRSNRLIQVGVITALVVIADLWSKAWAWERLREGKPITVIENWFYFEFGFNTGSAFSLGRDAGWARMAFIAVTILALLYMARLATTLPTRFGVAFVSVAMVAGGALGNLHDRLFRLMEIRGEVRHGVVDFIKVFYWPDKVWPTFNIADVALVVGVGLLLVFLTRHGDALDAELEAKKKAAAA